MEWTNEMGEISGNGGMYEETCRLAVCAGVAWLNENKNKVIASSDGETFEFAGTDEEIETNFNAFLASMQSVPNFHEVMEGVCCRHAGTIFWNGWDVYAEWMKKNGKRSSPGTAVLIFS